MKCQTEACLPSLSEEPHFQAESRGHTDTNTSTEGTLPTTSPFMARDLDKWSNAEGAIPPVGVHQTAKRGRKKKGRAHDVNVTHSHDTGMGESRKNSAYSC